MGASRQAQASHFCTVCGAAGSVATCLEPQHAGQKVYLHRASIDIRNLSIERLSSILRSCADLMLSRKPSDDICCKGIPRWQKLHKALLRC